MDYQRFTSGNLDNTSEKLSFIGENQGNTGEK
jgi:hypothetical protein